MTDYTPLHGDRFRDSHLARVRWVEWPCTVEFSIWSSFDGAGFLIRCESVLEHHFVLTGSYSSALGDGMPLSGVYTSEGPLFQHWRDLVTDDDQPGKRNEPPPVCLELSSVFFGNRERKPFVRDRDTRLLVVCRNLHVEEDRNYPGPFPYPPHVDLGGQ